MEPHRSPTLDEIFEDDKYHLYEDGAELSVPEGLQLLAEVAEAKQLRDTGCQFKNGDRVKVWWPEEKKFFGGVAYHAPRICWNGVAGLWKCGASPVMEVGGFCMVYVKFDDGDMHYEIADHVYLDPGWRYAKPRNEADLLDTWSVGCGRPSRKKRAREGAFAEVSCVHSVVDRKRCMRCGFVHYAPLDQFLDEDDIARITE